MRYRHILLLFVLHTLRIRIHKRKKTNFALMVFLNPAFLWAAAAISIPIIVHLFNFRKPKRMLFSNVAFVREVNRSVVRRVRLRQWLLLLTRCLAILALVAMFSGPVWKSNSNDINSNSAKSVLILIDNSPSMSAADNKGEYLYQARVMAKAIIQNGSNQDEYLIMPVSDLRPGQPYQKPQEVLAKLEEIASGHAVPSYEKLLTALPALTEKSILPEKRVYLISDFQASAFTTPNKLPESPSGIQVFALPVGTHLTPNLFVENLQLAHPILEPGKPITLNGVAKGSQIKENTETEITLFVNEQNMGNTKVLVPANDTASFQLSFTPNAGGWMSGYVEIKDGITAFDNKMHFTIMIPDSTRILVVEGIDTDNKYIRTALDKVFKQFRFTYAAENKLGDYDPESFDAIILSGVKDIPQSIARRLANWTDNGGSLMLFPHPDQQISGVNTLLQALNAGQFLNPKSDKNGIQIQSPDIAHPLFENVFKKGKNVKADGPLVFQWHPIQQSNVSQSILKFPDNSPFLMQTQTNKGQLFVFAVYPDAKQSDFPFKSIFIPVLYRSILLMTHNARTQLALELGHEEPVIVKSKSSDIIKLSSGNQEFIPEQFARSGQAVLNFSRVFPAPGSYNVLGSDKANEKISFNYPAAESQLDMLRGDALEQALDRYAPALGTFTILESNTNSISNDLALNEYGTPLWKYFLLIALLAIIAEIFILFSLSRKTEIIQPA
jgi:hypothetical protein